MVTNELENEVYVWATKCTGLGARAVVKSIKECPVSKGRILVYDCEYFKSFLHKIFFIIQIYCKRYIFKQKFIFVNLNDVPVFNSLGQVIFFHNMMLLPDAVNDAVLGVSLKKWLKSKLFRFFVQRCQHILVQTFVVEANLRKFVADEANIIVLMHPVKIYPNLKYRSKVMDKDVSLKLFYPASFYEHKNHMFLVNFVRENVNCRVEIILTITEDELDRLLLGCVAEVRGKFLAVGPLTHPECHRYLTACDAIISPSRHESLSLPLFEASRYRVPILCADSEYSNVLACNSFYSFSLQSTESLLLALLSLRSDITISSYRKPELKLDVQDNWLRYFEQVSSNVY